MNFSEKAERITSLKTQVFEVLNEYPGYENLRNKLSSELDEKEQDSKLRLVFAGQYSSGKSSIISALTDNKSIKIDSDIATDKSEDYEWRSVTLTDTPGISAGRPDHDKVTHQRIQHADILVYVVTYSLFDNVLIEDFKRLAIDYNYKHKMVLVVNKMYSEEGEYDQLCETYLKNLEQQIGKETIQLMPVAFVSSGNALEEDADFHPYGHMDDLVKLLDDMIEKNQSLAGVEAVAQIIATHIEDELATKVEGTTKEEQLLLQRIERVISQIKKDAESALREEASRIKALAKSMGSENALNVGTSETLEEDVQASSELLNTEAHNAFDNLTARFDELDKELDSELSELNDSNLAEQFFMRFEENSSENSLGETPDIGDAADFAVANQLSALLGRGSGAVASKAMGAKAGAGLLKASGASGSSVHQTVLQVGKALGVKFQPWQAVNIAKNIGNVAKVLGPIMAALPIIFEGIDIYNEEKREKKIAEARRNIREQFQDAGDQITQQMKDSAGEFITAKYGQLLEEISKLRRARINEAQNLETCGQKLKSLSNSLREVLV
ncbi:GTPase domain-containing protein [Idiomarina loihiensis]|uniref:Protein containing N-terminal predicted GTPase domain n=1 Tax=Idiomarina loihiensis (strain ATCC BAA-735 / DSM 15497 / L2-TR) TaxID=283942 RepID=Q5R084_IDILO|nr:GTPase domain-containing protein [Idiomarina loihiensis]AAV81376.1 Protein containing N-terminal predicted GTPase domain [Idiomarina loihiensis L2TR]AGM35403.1 GTPase domain-containing protein [Idiomarina loihiensis GSL 199]